MRPVCLMICYDCCSVFYPISRLNPVSLFILYPDESNSVAFVSSVTVSDHGLSYLIVVYILKVSEWNNGKRV